MTAIISDKFRIFNASQFLESLQESDADPAGDGSRMYFFVGRPQGWYAYLEIHSKLQNNFTVGREIFVGTAAGDYASTSFRATVAGIYDNALLLTDVFGSSGVNSAPALGSDIRETADGGSTISTNVGAQTGVYRYGTEDNPPAPLDNQTEKLSLYDEIIAAKKIDSQHARTVIRRYNWSTSVNPRFDMWKPNYSASGNGQTGISGVSSASVTSIADAKFYVMNSDYEVFKCLYNGETPSNPTGVDVLEAEQPRTTDGANYDGSTGIWSAPSGNYLWKHMYTIPTDDVIKFLSSDFMPIVESTNPSRVAVEGLAVDGALDVVLIEDAGDDLPTSATLYTEVQGDGSGAIVRFTTNAAGAITSAEMFARGSGYTYGNVLLEQGFVFTNSGLSSAATVPNTAYGSLKAVMPPQGGHGSDHEVELNGKRVMTNIRLTYDEGSGDFPVDNDFRRIGILKDPLQWGSSAFLTADTASGLKAVKITGADADYIVDERIQQTVTGGTAYGTVVSWTLDKDGNGNDIAGEGVLKYIQTTEAHLDSGVVRAFESSANAITGDTSAASGDVETGLANGTELLGKTFNSGLAAPEIENNSGDVIYVENRRLITRAPDQIEDIKLVIEF